MSKEIREQIDRVKNWKQFLNENIYGVDLDKTTLNWFSNNGLKIKSITESGKGENSKNYHVLTNNGEYSLNIKNDIDYDWVIDRLIDKEYQYLPKIYAIYQNSKNEYCLIMEFLFPISDEEKKVIDCVDYLFYLNKEDGLDIWLSSNLYESLNEQVETYIKTINYNKITEKQYIPKIKWFIENYPSYSNLINEIQHAFQEYNKVMRFNYSDFHGDNLMKDKNGSIKLIDL